MSDIEVDVDEVDEVDEDDENEAPALDGVTIRVIAAALCEGSWDSRSMLGRIEATIESSHSGGGNERVVSDWLARLVDEAATSFAAAPTLEDLARWIEPRTRIDELGRFVVRRYPTPAPEMLESPWAVPALATMRELAIWLGISMDALDSFARTRRDVPMGADIHALATRNALDMDDMPMTWCCPETGHSRSVRRRSSPGSARSRSRRASR